MRTDTGGERQRSGWGGTSEWRHEDRDWGDSYNDEDTDSRIGRDRGVGRDSGVGGKRQ